MSETALSSVRGWTATAVAEAAKAWITSAEQVVAVAATPAGLQALAEQLGTDGGTTRMLVAHARAVLAPDVLQAMERPELSDRGLGALPPARERTQRKSPASRPAAGR